MHFIQTKNISRKRKRDKKSKSVSIIVSIELLAGQKCRTKYYILNGIHVMHVDVHVTVRLS